MPAVVMANGAHTNHDRDSMANGINGVGHLKDYNGRPTPKSSGHQSLSGPESQGASKDAREVAAQAPPDLPHIEEGMIDLKALLTRLTQSTHNDLVTVVEELAAFGTPPPTGGIDDNSQQNIAKKVKLLKWLEQQHENFTKALVITNWSKISEDAGKLIDMKNYYDQIKFFYDIAFHEMSEMKRSLTQARVPNPDFNTALEVLSTGKATWMPDLGYIEPPPLTSKELLDSLRNLNTLLHERLHLHDYDKIPYHFRNYTIANGRVTFRVEDEFEVDLTIADEDPEKQFWFIDFRFLFTPSTSTFKEQFHYGLEDQVNAAIEKDGLSGCYHVLHEFTLTHKLSELRRQAYELSSGRWSNTLLVEPLHRGVSIQYWVDRYGEKGPKSWIMLLPHSGKKADGTTDEKTTSRIAIRWFRDGKEVKDVQVSLDLAALNIEDLIRSLIGLHVKHILLGIRTALRAKPLFKDQELKVTLKKCKAANGEPELQVQFGRERTIKVSIDHVTGRFAISPASVNYGNAAAMLNSQVMDPANNGHETIEKLRSFVLCEETVAKAHTVGWQHVTSRVVHPDEVRSIMPKGTLQSSWFRKPYWRPNWFLVLSSGMSGERWWLIAVTDVLRGQETGIAALDGPKIIYHMQIQTGEMCLQPTYELLRTLEVRASAMICFYINAKELHATKVPFTLSTQPRRRARTLECSSVFQMPDLYLSTKALLSQHGNGRPTTPNDKVSWTKQVLQISFNGLEQAHQASLDRSVIDGSNVHNFKSPSTTQSSQSLPSQSTPVASQSVSQMPLQPPMQASVLSTDAILIARGHLSSLMPSSLLSKPVDNVSFHPNSGGFAFRLSSKVGDAVIEPVTDQLRRVQRLVDFVNVVQRYPDTIIADSVGLQRVEFGYWYTAFPAEDGSAVESKIERAAIEFPATSDAKSDAAIPLPPKLVLENGNPHIRVVNYLSDLLASQLGLEALVKCLSLTLPIVRGLNLAEESWSEICATTRNKFTVVSRAADWHFLKYAFDLGERGTVKLDLELSCQCRQGESWWWLKKVRPLRDRSTPSSGQIAVDTVLRQKVWEAPATGLWEREVGGVYARVGGAEKMLLAVDEVLRGIALEPAALVINDTPAFEVKVNDSASAVKQEQQANSQLQAKAAAMPLNLPGPKAKQNQTKPAPRRPSATPAQSSPPKHNSMQSMPALQGAPVAPMHAGQQQQPQQQGNMIRQNSSQGQPLGPGQQRRSLSPSMQKKQAAAMAHAQQQRMAQVQMLQLQQQQGRPLTQQQQQILQRQQQFQAQQRAAQGAGNDSQSRGGGNKDEPMMID